MIESINVKRRGKVRRSKLNYLKKVKGAKAARIEEKDKIIVEPFFIFGLFYNLRKNYFY